FYHPQRGWTKVDSLVTEKSGFFEKRFSLPPGWNGGRLRFIGSALVKPDSADQRELSFILNTLSVE
ncbi:MAG: hypothetical protein D6820_03805, partial [Lentisphaerae bacterium]